VKLKILFASIIVAAVSAPLAAQAQQSGVPGGWVYGANEGYRIAGPIGAIVGAPVGGVVGGVHGVLGITYYDTAPRAAPARVARSNVRKARRAARRTGTAR
jgi:hypothetical protein